ncbi:hypothetical protein EDB83DRAFT_361915 [Lactarius deliciosus]|nr:hypothetical protein EDB83DRAFT_361915 [Lactarius deliciosus]
MVAHSSLAHLRFKCLTLSLLGPTRPNHGSSTSYHPNRWFRGYELPNYACGDLGVIVDDVSTHAYSRPGMGYWGLGNLLSLLLGTTICMGVCVTSALGCYWLIPDGVLHRLRLVTALGRRLFSMCS